MNAEITGDALNADSALIVVIGRAKTPVRNLADASAKYRAYIDADNLGARDALSCYVLDSGNVKVATVSYNGRVWSV